MNNIIRISLILVVLSVGIIIKNSDATAVSAQATCLGSNHGGFCSALGMTNWNQTITVDFDSAKQTLENYYNAHSANLAWSYMTGSGSTYYWSCVNSPIIKFVKSCGSYGACSETCGGGTKEDLCGNSTSCNTQSCAIPGECNSAVNGKEYPYGASVYGADQCTAGDPSNVSFPAPEQTVTWTCSGQHGGADSGLCSASQLKPDSVCGSSNSETNEINTKAEVESNQCAASNTVNELVTFNTNTGKWNWTCAHDYFHLLGRASTVGDYVDCSAPTCLTGNLIKYSANVYLKENLNDQTTNVSVVCNDPTTSEICCDIDSTDPSTNAIVKTHVCTGDVDKEIFVASGTNTYPAECYIKPTPDPDPGCEDSSTPPCPGETDKPLTISTMCSQKECNAQGTCQSTPLTASNLNQCSSTCNSNADCSSGRIIETRP
ncbi:MAG: hypothetical protein ACKUBY_00990 [Candidatus Moraniibacteriota bacterium]|jgi:hypothetical protein